MKQNNIDKKLNKILEILDRKFGEVNDRFASIDERFESIDNRFETMEEGMNSRFDNIEKQLDEKADAKQMDKLFEVVISMLDQKADKSEIKALDRKFDSLWLQQREMNDKLDTLLDSDDNHTRKFKEQNKIIDKHSKDLMKLDVRVSYIESHANF